jgi:O-antigen/teichoic acid export membrane protein
MRHLAALAQPVHDSARHQRVAGHVFWSGLEAVAAACLAFASAFIVARLIGPAEVGIAAAAVSVHVLLWVTVNALFADAIVQRASLDDSTMASAFWASTAVGVAASAIQLAAGPLLGLLLADHRLPAMSALLALPLPLVGAGGAMQGRLTRDRNYRALAGRTLIGQGLGTLVGIATALAGAGAWALVMQQAVSATTGALALLLRARWRPSARPRLRAVRELLALGLPLTASTLMQLGRYRLFALLIGATAGAAPLGEVHMAFRLVDTVRELTFTALWRLMLPAMSARQHDLPALRAALDRCLGLASLVVLPVLGAMVVVVVPLIALLLGPAWAEAGPATLPLIALTAWLFLWFPAGAALIARGVPGPALIANVAAVVAMLVGVAVVRPATPVQAMAIWLVAQLITSPYTVVMTARVLGIGWVGAGQMGTGKLGTARLLGTGRLLAPIRAGLPALGVAASAVAIALLVPWLIGEPEGPVRLIAARLAAGAPVCLLGLGFCLARTGLLSLGLRNHLPHTMRRRRHVAVFDAKLP